MSDSQGTINELKKKIDGMNYEQLLRANRFNPLDHPMHKGEVGTYFHEALSKKRGEVSDETHVAISKRIGWDPC